MRLPKLPEVLTDSPAAEFVDRAWTGFGEIATHEAESLDGLLLGLRERLNVARKARGVGELLRNQLDLLPATTARFADDHRVRLQLWRSLSQALKAPDATTTRSDRAE